MAKNTVSIPFLLVLWVVVIFLATTALLFNKLAYYIH
jgi:hypothetical protein